MKLLFLLRLTRTFTPPAPSLADGGLYEAAAAPGERHGLAAGDPGTAGPGLLFPAGLVCTAGLFFNAGLICTAGLLRAAGFLCAAGLLCA